MNLIETNTTSFLCFGRGDDYLLTAGTIKNSPEVCYFEKIKNLRNFHPIFKAILLYVLDLGG